MAELGALNSLLRSSSIEDHEEALRLAHAATKSPKSSDDLTAHHTKVVALLKLDRFDDALRALAAAGTRLEDQCLLEKAYALYKTGQLSESEAILRKAQQSSRGVQHVAAQVAYRAEKFDDAARIYRELLDAAGEGMVGEENDLRINLLAADAQLEWRGDGHLVPANEKQPGREEMEAFETAYNAACGCLARGDFAKAAMLLKRSRDLCEASEDLGDDEKQAELVPIIVQQAYVSTKLGKLEEAAALQNAVVLDEISDAATKAVAQNNALVLQPQTNPYITQKLVQAVPKIAGNDRLFEYQSTVLRRNKYIIELQCQKFPGVKKTTGHIIAVESSSPVSTDKAALGVIHAAAKAELQTGKDALRRILPMLESRPDDVGLLLTIIQLYIQTEQPGKALALLEAFFKRLEAATTPDRADVRFAPGLVALAVSLYRLQGRQTAIRAELARAAAHWEKSSSSAATTSSQSDSLLREAGIALLHSSNASDLSVSGAAFERLASATPDDRAARAGLVASFAVSDPPKASPHIDALSPVDKLISGVDVTALLSSGVATLPTPPAQASSKKRAAPADSEDATAAKKAKTELAEQPKKRRGKLPKDFDPSKKPDPERWLPLRDRSTYRPKGKKGKKRAAEATQGGPVKEEETLELVGGAGAVKVEKASGGGGGGGGAKGKKKKGKK
ncbi:hypothetical protein GE09DRAFT_996480 [Coniochaeta sp. 2T2.1]|nr:hypothetical protein GE09DRAFT_996480 [Coniochaeta sp. 2T2.1]